MDICPSSAMVNLLVITSFSGGLCTLERLTILLGVNHMEQDVNLNAERLRVDFSPVQSLFRP